MEVSELSRPFEHIASVNVETDEDDVVEIHMPQKRYSNDDGDDLLEDGWGPFCEVKIDEIDYDGPATYIFTVDGEIRYIGQTTTLSNIRNYYKRIQPSSCFEDGNPTFCRINNRIFDSKRRNKDVAVWANKGGQFKSELKKEHERREGQEPPWN
jgi:hypothetical protein